MPIVNNAYLDPPAAKSWHRTCLRHTTEVLFCHKLLMHHITYVYLSALLVALHVFSCFLFIIIVVIIFNVA